MQINQTIGSIVQALRTMPAATVANELNGISEKSLRHALKQAGYTYSNRAPKGWHYTGSGTEPITHNITDYLTTSNKTATNESSHAIHTQFTQEDIADLQHMLQEWRQQTSATPQQEQQLKQNTPNVHERIKALPTDDKVRKTIVIDQSIGNRLDDYCKTEKVNKSDIIHLALLDFIKNNI